MVPYPEAVAPLADGRVISVGVRAEPTGPLLELVASSARERRVLADVSFDDRVSVSVTRPEEGADGIVRFLVKEERAGKEDVYPYLYAYKRGSHGFRKTALPDGAQASFADGVLITVAKDRSKIQVSHDGGATFRDLDMPAGASTAFSSVTRLGLVSASHTRVGWEPLPEAETPPAQAPTMRIKAQAPVAKEALELSCTTSGPGKTGTLLPRYDGDLTVDFGVKAASKGVRREAFSSSSFVLDPKVLLLVEGKELPPGSAPAHVQANRWSVHWIDPTESGAKVRSVSAKAPYPDMRVPVRGVWARGGKVFFTVEVGEKKVLVRGKGSGFETAEVHPSLWPVAGEPQSFSADGSVIAYLAGGVLVVWKTGEAPKPIGVMNQRAGAMLGAPTKDGVPVFAEVEGQSYYRVFPLPADKLSGAPEEQIVRASWDGWTRSMTLLGGRGSVAFCDAKPAGNSFHATASAPTLWVRFEIDSSRGKSTGTVRYDAVTDGQSLCIEGLTAQIPNGIAIEVKAGGTTKTVEGLDVLRVAAKGRKGELTRSGRLDKVPLHAMTCAATPAAK